MEDVLTQLSMMSASGQYAVRWPTINAAMREISTLRAQLAAAIAERDAANERAERAEKKLSVQDNFHTHWVCREAYDALMCNAAQMRDALEKYHSLDEAIAACDEHAPEMAPESCGECFPIADDARLSMRAALSANPAASLEAHDRRVKAEALREQAGVMLNLAQQGAGSYSVAYNSGIADAAVLLRREADRLESAGGVGEGREK